MKLKSALCKQRSFFTNVSQSSEYSVKASFAIIEMIAKSSRPFHEKGFIGYSLLLQGLLQYLEVHLFVNNFFSSMKFNTSVLSHDWLTNICKQHWDCFSLINSSLILRPIAAHVDAKRYQLSSQNKSYLKRKPNKVITSTLNISINKWIKFQLYSPMLLLYCGLIDFLSF